MNPNEFARNFFETNRSISAEVRDGELECARLKVHPVNLGAVPADQWDAYINHHVELPPAVATYLAGRPEEPFTTEEIDNLEEAIEKAYGMTAPYGVIMCPQMTSGRRWAFIEDAAPYLSGFLLIKEESLTEFNRRMSGS